MMSKVEPYDKRRGSAQGMKRSITAWFGVVFVLALTNGALLPTVRFSVDKASTPAASSSVTPLIAFQQIRMIDHTNGWAVDQVIDGKAHVLHTGDGGETWRDVTPPENPEKLNALQFSVPAFFMDKADAWVVYSPDLWYTYNGGQSWAKSGIKASGSDAYFSFIDARHGWVLFVDCCAAGDGSWLAAGRLAEGHAARPDRGPAQPNLRIYR